MNPKISVIMPVYNSAKYLQESVQSILDQTFNDFELLLINDCSTDNSLSLMYDLQKKDNRIVIINQETNSGPAVARNVGLDKARGEYIAIMDSDDIAIKTRFEEQITVFKDPKIGICGSWYTEFGENLKNHLVKSPIQPNAIKIAFLTYDCLGNSTVMFRKNILEGFRFNLNYIVCEDYNFWCELLLKTSCSIIPKSLVQYRVHSGGISKMKIEKIEAFDKIIKLDFYKKAFKIDIPTVEEINYFNLFNFKKKLNDTEIIKTIDLGVSLIKNNALHQEFDVLAFENRVYYLLNKCIKHGNIKYSFLRDLSKSHPIVYSKINIITKLKVLLK